MGKGKYANGNVELHVSILEEPDAPTLERWKKSFEVASRLLYYATGGNAQFAKIYLSTGGDGAEDADATVSIHQASSYANGHPTVFLEATLGADSLDSNETLSDGYLAEDLEDDGPFAEETVMSLGEDAYRYPFVILHEFGHYGFGLGDEYYEWSTGDTMRCSELQQVAAKPASADPKAEHACIMGVPSLGLSVGRFLETTPSPNDITARPASDPPNTDTVSNDVHTAAPHPGYEVRHGWIVEFCTKHNHNPANSMQSYWRGVSCREAIAESRQIWVPSTLDEPDDDDPPVAPELEWPATTNDSELGFGVDLAQVPGLTENVGDPPDWAVELLDYPQLLASPDDRISLTSIGEGESAGVVQPTSNVNEALDWMRSEVGGPGPRAAEVAAVVFSTGSEKIREPRKLAASLAAGGIRLFTVGVGRDRAALQQLAQRTGGAYFEVNLSAGRKAHENRQLVRNHVARSFERLRYGAPLALVSRAELVGGNAEFQVEQGSKSLKLVFTKAPGSQTHGVVLRRNGEQVDKSELRWTSSTRGSFQVATIDTPDPGAWSVAAPSGAPPSLDLTVYSKNPRVRLGVTGWRRLRIAGETVKLLVVVRAPVAVVGLAEAVVRVSPPAGRAVETIAMEPTRDGVHFAEFKVEEAGAYDVEVFVRGDGDVSLAGPAGARGPAVVKHFQRTRRVQVHVATVHVS